MSDNKFDQKIADQLHDLEMPYEPASWDLLQSKLDQLAAPPQPTPTTPPPIDSSGFDQRMKAMLEEVDMPYQSAHWERMSAQLNNAGAERLIRRYKISEAAAVLLFALAFQAALNSGNSWFKMPRQQQSEPQEQIEMANKAKKQRQHTTNGTIAASIVAPETLPTLPLPIAVGYASTTSAAASNHSILLDGSMADKLAAAIIPVPAHSTAAQTTLNAALLGPDGLPIVPKGLRPLTLLAALGLDQLPFPQPTLPAMAGLATKPTNRYNKHSKTYLMAYGGTEKQRYQGANNYNTDHQTANMGLRLGRRKDKWGMEVGFEHTPLAFQPEDGTIAFHKDNNKVFATKYSKVRANIVSVPANVTRQIAKMGKTSLHAVAGVAAHFATSKSYFFEETEVANAPSAQGNKPALPNGKGLLEGSALYGNSYATANAGMRIEHRVGRRTTAYVEPQVRRFMGGRGVGPNRGKTNSIGVQAGVLAMIGS